METTRPVWDLDLPLLDTTGLDREESISIASAMAREHWIVRTDVGVALLRYSDVTAILRDRRFHDALALIPRMGGVEPGWLPGEPEAVDPGYGRRGTYTLATIGFSGIHAGGGQSPPSDNA